MDPYDPVSITASVYEWSENSGLICLGFMEEASLKQESVEEWGRNLAEKIWKKILLNLFQ